MAADQSTEGGFPWAKASGGSTPANVSLEGEEALEFSFVVADVEAWRPSAFRPSSYEMPAGDDTTDSLFQVLAFDRMPAKYLSTALFMASTSGALATTAGG